VTELGNGHLPLRAGRPRRRRAGRPYLTLNDPGADANALDDAYRI